MNIFQEILQETYCLTNNGKLETFKKYLNPRISWTEAKGFPYAGTYVGPNLVVKNVHQCLGTEWQRKINCMLLMDSWLLYTDSTVSEYWTIFCR